MPLALRRVNSLFKALANEYGKMKPQPCTMQSVPRSYHEHISSAKDTTLITVTNVVRVWIVLCIVYVCVIVLSGTSNPPSSSK